MLLRFALVVVAILGVAGCAALPLPALGAAALSGGATSAGRAGTETTLGGSARRTVSLPADTVHDTVLATLARLGVTVTEEERERDGRVVLRGSAYERSVAVVVEPVTPVMTRFGVTVRHQCARRPASWSDRTSHCAVVDLPVPGNPSTRTRRAALSAASSRRTRA